ncbi:3D-(3,5/4)-trihydroxycyclohexane-1,2-dione hydrolase [Halalkalicoccus paucihalophilus]|uniref:3D-(3,5/4)-trihydroxycyclohexane-1,2-dione hydrolase n=1 Tax=Halalkalicoccus paucihalophilus TaxID=1008153 RepID=A0A151AHR3_9EURY|nr:acetolactate synthase large subunit [Halalkalicoccus paucihalophilus]KYH27199.1 3D-(3,5/4)-trihydroxycyclohexane-1,2-dione hydrolase [Halalkalicoccus paucihalophilus]
MVKASDLLVECLAAEGVEYVFGVPGEELEDLLFSIRDSDIRFVPTRHEQGAAFMADVQGRLTGEAGVCLSTLGPGATNLLTGVADAHLDKSPLVAITGQGGRERLHKESHQALDIVHTFEPVVKWNTQLGEPEIVAESVRKAFKLAEHEKPGATHLEFPEDVAAEETTDTPLPTRERVRRSDPDPDSIERAATLLERAERPIVLAGNGAVRTRARGAGRDSASANRLRDLVERAGVPVVATYMGKGAISDRRPHSLLTLDSGPDGEAADAIENADCVLAVGYDIAEHDPAGWNPDLDTTVIHIDHEPAEVYRHYNPEIEIVADIPASLRALSEAVRSGAGKAWCTDVHDRILEDVTRRPDPDEPFSVRRTLPILREVMADDDILISDVGSHKMAIAQNFPTYEPNTCIISNGLASMGIAVPGGLAADLACESNVVAATGDGGFLMNGAEIETATRLGLDYTILLFNDDDYGLISEKQIDHTGEHFGTELSNPDFVAFAESFGIEGHRPETWSALEETLNEVVTSEGMALVEVGLG